MKSNRASYIFIEIKYFRLKPAIAAMHGPHSVFDIGRLYNVMPEVCRWLTKEKQRKTDIRLADQ